MLAQSTVPTSPTCSMRGVKGFLSFEEGNSIAGQLAFLRPAELQRGRWRSRGFLPRHVSSVRASICSPARVAHEVL